MGKSNRIRNSRASDTLSAPKTTKKKQGMPSWAINLITILVAAVILLSAAFMFLNSNGVFARMQTAMKSDNFRVDANMMKYFFQTQYSEFVSSNSSYLSSFGLDTSKSLKDQTVSFGEEGQTWYDYMMSMAESQVKSLLIYCEEAETRGLELSDAEKASIDAQIELMESTAAAYGYTADAYLALIYGKGVTKGDIRNCMEIEALANLCMSTMATEIKDGITATDILTKYDSDKKTYNVVDMISYSLTVTYSEAKKACASDADEATIIAKYKEMIADAKAKAEALKATTDKDAFESLMAEYIVDKYYDSNLTSAEADTKVAVAEDKKPTAEGFGATIKKALTAQIKALIVEDADFNKDDIAKENKIDTVEGISDEYVAFIKTVAEAVYNDAKSVFDGTDKQNVKYNSSDDMSKWAFDDARVAGDKNYVEKGDKAIADDAKASSLTSYTVNVAYILEKEHPNETLSKNIALAVFGDEAKAKAALEALKAGITLDEFKAAVEKNGASYTSYSDYTKGTSGISDFDTWLYKDSTTVGSYTTEVIKVTSSGSTTSATYLLALYHADGREEWRLDVEESIFTERSTAATTALTEKYPVKINDKVIAKIG